MSQAKGDPRSGLVLSPGPSSLGEALGAVAILLADGALNGLAEAPAALWRPWLGLAVTVTGVHAVWEIARTRRLVAGPGGVHWAGGLSPSAGAVPWGSVWRIDSLHGRFGSRWRVVVLHGSSRDPRLITLRGPGRWSDLRGRTPDPIAAWWRAAGDEIQVHHFDWGWRLEAERTLPPRRRAAVMLRRALRA
jgi:hypothetical protein